MYLSLLTLRQSPSTRALAQLLNPDHVKPKPWKNSVLAGYCPTPIGQHVNESQTQAATTDQAVNAVEVGTTEEGEGEEGEVCGGVAMPLLLT